MKSVAYEAVYNQIIAEMANGVVPWKKSWKGMAPLNGRTGRAYSGINFILLMSAGYSDPRWMTAKQVIDAGGNINKGEKSRQVVFWQILSKEENGKKKSVPLLKYFNVFNVEQTSGLKLEELTTDVTKNVDAETIIDGFGDAPVIKHGFGHASYIPKIDEVHMPNDKNFDTGDNYYATLFHELVHSTGAEKRLNRKSVANFDTFGSVQYSEEELIAEFGAAFLANAAGIENTLPLSASYIKGWMKAFEDNPAMIVHAASKAQKAADYILGLKSQEEAA